VPIAVCIALRIGGCDDEVHAKSPMPKMLCGKRRAKTYRYRFLARYGIKGK
jgi:hypothetical protein